MQLNKETKRTHEKKEKYNDQKTSQKDAVEDWLRPPDCDISPECCLVSLVRLGDEFYISGACLDQGWLQVAIVARDVSLVVWYHKCLWAKCLVLPVFVLCKDRTFLWYFLSAQIGFAVWNWKCIHKLDWMVVISIYSSLQKCTLGVFDMEMLKPFIISYVPTSPLGQDMTQGQFLSGV